MNLTIEQEKTALTIILVVGFILRVVNLDSLAPMVDETGHLWESVSYAMCSPLDRLLCGKYLGFLFYKPIFLGAHDPLYFARILTALFSTLTAWFIYKIGRVLGGGFAGIIAALLYAISPFALFHDRQAIFDPLVTTFFSISLYMFVRGYDDKKWWFWSGFFFLLMASTKITALASAVTFIALAICAKLGVGPNRPKTSVKFNLSRWYYLPLGFVVALTALLMTAPTPGYDLLNIQKVLDQLEHFLLPKPGSAHQISDLWVMPHHLLGGLIEYSGILFLALILAALVYCILNKCWLPLVLIASAIISVFPFAILSSTFNKYIHFIQAPLYLGVALALRHAMINLAFIPRGGRRLDFLKKNWMALPAAVLILFFALNFANQSYVSIRMMQNPYYRIAKSDKFDYELGWSSSIGINEVVSALEKIALHSDKKLYVVTIGWGMHGVWTLPLRLRDSKYPISFYHSWIHSDWQRDELREVMKNNRLIFLLEYPVNFVEESDLMKIGSRTKVLFEYQKKDPKSKYVLLELTNDNI